MKKPLTYIFVLFDLTGFEHEFLLTELEEEVMKVWEEDVAAKGTRYLHGFLYVRSNVGFSSKQHLLKSF
jgi:hypothetical protein